MGFFDTPSRSAVREQEDLYLEKSGRLTDDAREYFQRGRYPEAEEKVRELINLQSRVVGERHPDYAGGLTMLAEVLMAQDELHDAEVLVQRALEIRKKALGERHPDYAASLDLLGRLMLRWEDFEGAEPHLRKALDVRRQVLGEGHPDYAASLGTLAELLRRRGDLDAAEPLSREALERQQAALGGSHADCAEGLLQHAEILMHLGRFEESEARYREATDLLRNQLGEAHPAHQQALTGLAALLLHKGDLDEAEGLWQLLLEMRRQALGERHPECANVLAQLATVRQRRNDLRGAEALLRQAVDIRRQAQGDRHPEYATALTLLGQVLQRAGNLNGAEPLLRQALAIRKDVLGARHPEYATSLLNLASLVLKRGDATWARILLRDAAELRRSLYGDHHPEYAHCLAALADVMVALGDQPARAEALLRQALEIRAATLGTRHPVYAANLSSLAGLMRRTGDLDAAERLLREALDVRREALGVRHPDYVTNLGNLAWVLQQKQDLAGAEALLAQSLEIRKEVLGGGHPDTVQNRERLEVLRGQLASSPQTPAVAALETTEARPPAVEEAPSEGDEPAHAEVTEDDTDYGPADEEFEEPVADAYAEAVSDIYADEDEPFTDDPDFEDGEGPAGEAVALQPDPDSSFEGDEPLRDESAGFDPVAETENADEVAHEAEALALPLEMSEEGEAPDDASSPWAVDEVPGSVVLCGAVSEEPDAESFVLPATDLVDGTHDEPCTIERVCPDSPQEDRAVANESVSEATGDEPDDLADAVAKLDPVAVDEPHDMLVQREDEVDTPAHAEGRALDPDGPERADGGDAPDLPAGGQEAVDRPLPAVMTPFPVERLGAGPAPAGSLSMSQSSSQLSQELAAMSDRFSDLGERLLTAARQLHAPGVPPAEELLDAVATCRREFLEIRDRARGLAESLFLAAPPVEQLGSLHDVTALLDQTAEAEIRQSRSEELRRRAVALLDRVLSVRHASDPEFAPLRGVHDAARGLRSAVSDSTWTGLPGEAERLAEGDHPIANLLTLVSDHSDLDDEVWASLHESVGSAFGKQLAAAAARAKLVLPAADSHEESHAHAGAGH